MDKLPARGRPAGAPRRVHLAAALRVAHCGTAHRLGMLFTLEPESASCPECLRIYDRALSNQTPDPQGDLYATAYANMNQKDDTAP